MWRTWIALSAVVLILGPVSATHAQSGRLVRVIWDVGAAEANRKEYYGQIVDFEDIGDRFEMPPRTGDGFAGFTPFSPMQRGSGIGVRRGDHVVLYITNYNPVSHRPGKGTVIAPDPQLPLGATALSAVLNVLSGGVAGLVVSPGGTAVGPTLPKACRDGKFNVGECVRNSIEYLEVVRRELRDLERDVGAMVAVNAAAQRLPGDLWGIFDRHRAERRLSTLLDRAVKVDGEMQHESFDGFVAHVGVALATIDSHTSAIAHGLHAVDQNCATGGEMREGCTIAGRDLAALRRGYASVVTILDHRGNDRSSISSGLSEFRSAANLVIQYRAQLSKDRERQSVVALEVSSEFPSGRRMVVQLPFVSREKDSTAQITRGVGVASVRQKTTTTSFYGTCGWFEW